MPEVVRSPSDSNETKKPWYKTLEGWKVILEIVGIIFAVGYAVVTFLQWRALRHNFEFDQRAWIKVDVGVPAILEPQSPVVFNIRNVGKSPALRLFGGAIVQVVDANSAPSYPHGATKIRQFTANMLFPSDFTSFSSGRTPNNPDGTVRPLNDDEMRRLTSGDAYIAAFGIIAYRDQFGDHWTRFCDGDPPVVGS